MITENLSTLKINKLTQAQYDRELADGNVDEFAMYLTPDIDYMTALNPTGTGSFSLNRLSDSTIGDCSFAEGSNATASGWASHAGGVGTTASGNGSFAIGADTVASGVGAVTMGGKTEASGTYAIAVGTDTSASGDYSFASGGSSEASGIYSHAEGYSNNATNVATHAEGSNTLASGECSHAEGFDTKAWGYYSHVEGYCNTATSCQHVSGKYNTVTEGPTVDMQDATNSDAVFIIGCGTSTATMNAFRVSSGGKCFGSTTFTASGADFAELFEWVDGNPNNDDRRGLFVTLEGDKIRLANAGDDYIGIISGNQAFIGNSASEEWQGKYATDIFGSRIVQEVNIPEEVDEETGNVIAPAYTAMQYVVNPDYNPSQKYVMRENRKEWGVVGLIGQVVLVDDGTCVVGGYTSPIVGGIGTASDSGYRVMKRIDENHIKVLVK